MVTITSKQPLPRDSGMSDTRILFYKKTIDQWISDKERSILVVGGGNTDRDVFHSLGFQNVVISNLDSRLKGDEFSPYEWIFQQVEKKAALKMIIISALKPLYQIFTILFPKQQNLFAFQINKPDLSQDMYDWIKIEAGEIKFNYEWAKEIYK